MKKIYILFTALMALLFAGSVSVKAETVTFEVSANTGFWTDWNNNPNNSWAKTWESTQDDPHITIHEANNANNMRFWDGTHLMFFNSQGGRTQQENYDITVSTGWNITGVSIDFTCGEVSGVVGDKNAGVSISIYGEEAVENWSSEEFEHVELMDLEESKVTFTVASLTDGKTTFANTKNFIITLERKAGIDVAWDKFQTILEKYEQYNDEELFPVGTAPGLYDEAARQAFFDALAAGYATENIPTEELTEELLETLGQAIADTYEALIGSKNMNYELPAGFSYFRIKAAMTYTNEVPTGDKDSDGFDITDMVELPKYMMSVKNGNGFVGYWATPDASEPLDQLQALWSIVKDGDVFDVINQYSDSRFNNVARSTAVAMSPESENLLAFDPVFTDEEEGVTYLNIRVSTQNGADGLYLHQNGHSSGSGVQNTIVGWYSTYSFASGPAASEWILEPVSDEEAAAIIQAGAAAKNREIFENDYKTLIETANLDLASAQTDMIAEALITDAGQFSSPWTDTSEGTELGALIDGDPATFWHSNWHNGAVTPHTHYLQVELNEPTHELTRIVVGRRRTSGNHITLWSVYGTNDERAKASDDEDEEEAEDVEWTPLAKLYTPYSGDNTETVRSRAFDSKGFKYLRFYIDGNTGGSGIGHMSEFQIEAVTVAEGTQYAKIAPKAETLTQIIAEQEFTAIADITEEQGAALQAAYDAFQGSYVAPTELRELIASADALAQGIIVGTDPGYWADNSLQEALASVVGQAKAYDEAQEYTAEQSDAFIAAINKAMEPVLAAANGIQEGKWYTIRFGSEADFETYGWDPVAGEAIVAKDADTEEVLDITDEALWDKLLTVATYSNDTTYIDDENFYVKHIIEPIDLEDVRLGNRLFVDDKDDIENPDMSKFRFVAVGDSAYLLQNKATGLFLRASGTSGAVSLHIIPSLFKVRAIGFGQNVIAATDIKGNSQSNLHIQRDYNTLVTWNVADPGSRSGLYIHEEEAVAEDNVATDFVMNVRQGQIYTFCYPIDLSLGKDNDGQMYTVNRLEETKVILAPIASAAAGRPFIYIKGETSEYDAENDAEPTFFAHGYSIAIEPDTAHVLKGSYTNLTPGAGNIIVNESKRNEFTVTRPMMENSTITSYQAYIAPAEKLSIGTEIEIVITNEEDGIATVLSNVSRSGEIYTIDGRLVAKKGNLNTLRTLGRGVYILNGTKVVVK